MNRAQLDEIMGLVDRQIGQAGYQCVEAEWVSAAGSGEGTLRLYVDLKGDHEGESPRENPEGNPQGNQGIDLDGCVKVNRLLEKLTEKFALEVSSPGLERPLRRHGCFARHVGSRIKVRLGNAAEGRRRVTGRLVGVDPGEESPKCQVRIKMETEEGPWSFPLANLEKASLVHEWDAGRSRHA